MPWDCLRGHSILKTPSLRIFCISCHLDTSLAFTFAWDYEPCATLIYWLTSCWLPCKNSCNNSRIFNSERESCDFTQSALPLTEKLNDRLLFQYVIFRYEAAGENRYRKFRHKFSLSLTNQQTFGYACLLVQFLEELVQPSSSCLWKTTADRRYDICIVYWLRSFPSSSSFFPSAASSCLILTERLYLELFLVNQLDHEKVKALLQEPSRLFVKKPCCVYWEEA